ncbi:MAG: M20/M25/M40 family metallo-hydrolase, partial [Bacteroidales bacterium]
MKKIHLFLILYGLFLQANLFAQKSPQEKGLEAITKETVQAQLEFLASDWTEGRETGTKGIYLAGDYVASMFKYAGIKPGGDNIVRRRMRRGDSPPPQDRSYFQNFTLLEPVPDGSSSITIRKGQKEISFQENVDFRISGASVSTRFTGTIVFVGYGIESKDFGIDNFSGADLKGKIALRLSGFPGQNDTTSVMYKKLMEDRMAAYQLNRNKDEKLKELGALGALEIDLNTDVARSWGEVNEEINLSPNEASRRSDWSRMRLDDPDAVDDPVSVTITQKVMEAILNGSGIDLKKYESDAASGKSFKPVELKNTSVGMDIRVNSRRVGVRNVVGLIEGENMDEFIVVGAHMDHMGMSGGRVWNGADDNASGTVGVMAIAQAFAAAGVKPEKSILFCAWTGEEKGLLGSKYFSLNPTSGSIDQYEFYLNYDMISRDSPDDEEGINCGVTYTKAYPRIEEITKNNAEE